MKNLRYLLVLTISALAFVGCSEDYLSVENVNSPEVTEVLSNPDDVYSLMEGTTSSMLFSMHNLYNVHLNGLADQTTSTNLYLSFWNFTEQPRIKLTNATTWGDLAILSSSWDQYSLTISTSNNVLSAINNGGFIVDTSNGDKTDEVRMGALFNRGMSMAHAAVLYDQFYVVDENRDLGADPLNLQPASEVMTAAIADIEAAIQIAETTGASWEFVPTQIYTSDEFVKIAHSYIARFMLAMPRNASEATSLDYATIKSHADMGIDFDFNPAGNADFYANSIDWTQYNVGDGAGYLPTDQKIVWMFDNTMPKDYPLDPTNNVLPPVTTNDARASLYYGYSSAFGFLREDRNANLFSNYYLNRWAFLGEDADYPASTVPFFLQAENTLIQAECMWRMGDNAGALAAINTTPRNTVGGLTETDNSDANIEHVLHYEYSVELDCTGQGLQLAFMRRHDLLQDGTPLHYPVPASEMEILLLPAVSYGGAGNGDGVNTATGSNSWK